MLVVESLGRTWLFKIAPIGWRARGGTRIARIGPLPLSPPTRSPRSTWKAFKPGMNTMVHRNPGVEAWLTLEGSMCLETPEGKLTQKAGDRGMMVRGGVPMMLTGTGTRPRRPAVLVLKDAAKPRATMAADWTPKGLSGA